MAEDARKSGRVLLVTRNFPPLRGGMERVNQRLLAGLAARHEAALCGPTGCAAHVPAGTWVVSAPVGNLVAFLSAGTIAAARLALRFRPRVVIAGSGLTVPIAWLAARLVGARLAAYLHGLDIVASSSIYRLVWRPWLSRCDLVFANSSNTARLARNAGVATTRIRIVHPGTDPAPRGIGKDAELRARLAPETSLMLLSVGRLTPRKGLAEFIRDVLPQVRAKVPDVRLLVVGHDPEQALQRPGHPESARIRKITGEAGLDDHVIWLEPCDDGTLSAIYAVADVHVFPVRETPGDVEGFGMVAIEAAAHGLPTVAYAVDGVPDAVLSGTTGELVAAGDSTAFAVAIHAMAVAGRDHSWQVRCRDAARQFGWDRFDQGIAREIDALLADTRGGAADGEA